MNTLLDWVVSVVCFDAAIVVSLLLDDEVDGEG